MHGAWSMPIVGMFIFFTCSIYINNRPLKTSLSYAKLELKRTAPSSWTTAGANFFFTLRASD
jgi:hypothetical protein